MTEPTLDDRLKSAKQEIQGGGFFLGLLLGVLIVIVGQWLFSEGYWTNIYTEIFGIVVSVMITVFILDRRAREREENALKKRLVREASGQSNEIAKAAIDWMRDEGWLTGEDGLLVGANLENANLQSADLKGANLTNVNLSLANLEGADLRNANLSGSKLFLANLSHANLDEVDMSLSVGRGIQLQDASLIMAKIENAHIGGAKLQNANLAMASLKNAILISARFDGAYMEETNFENADLKRAILSGSCLAEANLSNTRFDTQTAMPDSKFIGIYDEFDTPLYDKYWSPRTNLEHYTNRDHPDFWPSKYELIF